jgi:hypothetical protein
MRPTVVSVLLTGGQLLAPPTSSMAGQLVLAPTAVITADVPIVLTPDGSRAPFATVPATARVQIVGRTGEWYKVSYRDQHRGQRVG